MHLITLRPTGPWGDTSITHDEAVSRIVEARLRLNPRASALDTRKLEGYRLTGRMHLPDSRLIHVHEGDIVLCPYPITQRSAVSQSEDLPDFPNTVEARHLGRYYREPFADRKVTHLLIIDHDHDHQRYVEVPFEYAHAIWERNIAHMPITVVADFDCDANPE